MFHKILNIKLSISVVALLVMLASTYGEVRKKEAELSGVRTQLTTYKTIADKALGVNIDTLTSVKVTVTSYNPTRRQCDSTPLYGSDGELVTPGIIAVSQDLRKKYGIKDGDVVILEGYGKFTVKDSMHPRWKKRVDILSLIPKYSSAFGAKTGVPLYFNKER